MAGMITTGTQILNSKNFEFLRGTNPDLAELGGFAEHYAYTDPAGALFKLRLFGETLVSSFYAHHGIERPPGANFLELLKNHTFVDAVPKVVLDKLHSIRITGNQAAHGTKDQGSEDSLWILKEAFNLGRWFSVTVHGADGLDELKFVELPKSPDDSKGRLKREKKEVLQKLAAQEAQMQALLEELEVARTKAAVAEKSTAELEDIFQQTSSAANALHFSEEETRKKLIDKLLVQAEWKVGDNNQVAEEVEVDNQPTDSGLGYVDYVLLDDNGTPLAIIEAKKAAHAPEKGRKQAKLYADSLEQKYGRRPLIFYTNGFEVWFYNDVAGEVPRKLFGFYTKDSLQRVHFRNENKHALTDLLPSEDIAGRLYQMESIKRVCERFESKRRKALLVQATGTGKTRVAIAISEILIRARWAKRVLFLCDRRELRKQAKNAYSEHLSAEPLVLVTAKTSDDRNKSIYLATYPAMMKCFQNFDVGFFDLIIADESHRSIYNRYRDLFVYFDALQIGLTATPVKKILHNTFKMFDCEDGDPTATYEYNEAITDTPPWLCPFRVVKHTTKFMREGIRYQEMTPEQQAQLDEQVEDSEAVDYAKEAIGKQIFNKDTDRQILRNLMENGLREATDQHIGKTIVFARNHEHAMQLQHLFEEMYPQYMKSKKEFCAVIDNYIDRAEQLIDDFKGDGENDNLHIAISVDMLDTGIDVPEIINLVFAKPVKSYVKFWQMIGRGTRLCRDLFGPGQHKSEFLIFDHWGNFEWFGENPPEVEPSPSKSLMQKIFDSRIDLGEAAIKVQDTETFDLVIELLERDLNALPDDTIAIREKWRTVETMKQDGVIRKFDAATIGTLRMEIAPLMQWRNFESPDAAYRLDWLVGRLQVELLEKSSVFEDHRAAFENEIVELPINLLQVKEKIDWINKVKSAAWWSSITVAELEEARRQLRGIMHLKKDDKIVRTPALNIDVTDSHIESEEHHPKLEGLELAAYRKRVESVFSEMFEESPALQKIKLGEAVSEEELRDLVNRVTMRDPNLKVDDILLHYPNAAQRLDLAIRRVIGLDAEAVDQHFTTFVQANPSLSSHQMRFLGMIKNHIARFGALEIDKLYEAPFTQIHTEGVDGVFTDDAQVDALLTLITKINDLAPASQ